MIRAHIAVAMFATLAACTNTDHRVVPKGPLAQWLPYPVVSWDQCPLDSTTTYDPPFWRAPYRHCGSDRGDGFDRIEFDADTVVVSLYSARRVPGPDRTAEFEKAVLEIERRLGPPQQRAARCATWSASDTLQAEVSIRATGDVAPALYDQPWTVVKTVRRGPLDSQCSVSRDAPPA
jgi:hypothetical protein